MHDALRATLKSQAGVLSKDVLDRMYDNPFWMERYGQRGRQHADQDSLYHLQYLDAALAADDPHVFERYAQWLRSVLVSRGMCSEHLAENFRLVADGIAGTTSAAAPALAILARGIAALAYCDGEASRLEMHRDRLQAAVDVAAGNGAMREDDRRYLVSYLIDAAATGERQAFEAFAARSSPEAVAALAAAVRAL